MVPNVSIRCAFCGGDISINEARYSIKDDIICTDCAATATLSDLFSSEKINSVSIFDGEIWWNSAVGPKDEGGIGENYDAEISAE